MPKCFTSTLHCLWGLWVKNWSCYSQFNFIQPEGQIPRANIPKRSKTQFLSITFDTKVLKRHTTDILFPESRSSALKWTFNTHVFSTKTENLRGQMYLHPHIRWESMCILGWNLPFLQQKALFLIQHNTNKFCFPPCFSKLLSVHALTLERIQTWGHSSNPALLYSHDLGHVISPEFSFAPM